MKTSFSSLFIVSASLVIVLTLPATKVSAIKFRRPINNFSQPMVSAFYDHDTSSGAKNFYCSRDNVYDNHRGTDFRASTGTAIYAAAGGSIYYRYDGCPTVGYQGSTCGGGFGNHIKIDHEGAPDGIGWVSIYGHMSIGSPIPAFQSVPCGTLIGLSGSSGSSTGPHVHFEVRKYGYPKDDPFIGTCSIYGGFWNNSPSYMDSIYTYMDTLPTTQCVN